MALQPTPGRPSDRVRRWCASWRIRLMAVAAAAILGPALVQWAIMCWHDHRLIRQLQRRQTSYESLKAEQEHLRTDPVYVEGLTRTTFKVAKPGELVVPLSDPFDAPAKRKR